MMQLLSAWKESILLFKPSNFKLFLLVTLKSFIDSGKVWVRYWWWLIGVVIVGGYLISNLLDYFIPISGKWIVSYKPFFVVESSAHIGRWISDSYEPDMSGFPLIDYSVCFIIVCFLSLLYMSLYLSARPSVAIKNWRYFLGYGKQCVYFTGLFLLLNTIMAKCFKLLVLGLFGIDSGLSRGVVVAAFGLVSVFSTIIFSIVLLYMVFLLDSDASLKQVGLSLYRAAKLVMYNLPFLLISMTCITLLYFAVQGIFFLGALCIPISFEQPIFQHIIGVLFNSVDIFFMLLLACFFVNYYIKKIHDNYSLYFE